MVGVLLPEQDGTYDLELRIEQVDGARFQEAGNQPYEARVHVAGGMARLEEPPR
jgi:hypothetical protein